MTFTWLSLMNPHRLAYGFAFSFPFVAIVGGLTLIMLYMRPGQIKLPKNALTIVLMLFMAWMTLTTPFAFEQERAWGEWNRVMKTLFFAMVTIAALNNEKDTKLFALVVTLSLAFYGLKGGVFTLLSGGSSRVMGPPGTYIGDNNDLALALLTIVPLIWYQHLQATKRWLRWAWAILALLTATAVIGSYSRGALVGGAAMLFMLWLKSRNKLRTGIVVLLLVPLVFMLMPEKWFGRMESIGEYQADGSAMGRVNAWKFALNVATDNFMGGGYLTFTPRCSASTRRIRSTSTRRTACISRCWASMASSAWRCSWPSCPQLAHRQPRPALLQGAARPEMGVRPGRDVPGQPVRLLRGRPVPDLGVCGPAV
jgi:putative inorganic carbon (HCO3(-)) transporter